MQCSGRRAKALPARMWSTVRLNTGCLLTSTLDTKMLTGLRPEHPPVSRLRPVLVIQPVDSDCSKLWPQLDMDMFSIDFTQDGLGLLVGESADLTADKLMKKL